MSKYKLLHVALQYKDEKKAIVFFSEVLGLSLKNRFKLSSSLAEGIFDEKKDVKVLVFSNESLYFEIFITEKLPVLTFQHICLVVDDKNELLKRCMDNDIEVIIEKRSNKEYIFIKDHCGYLYEIKE